MKKILSSKTSYSNSQETDRSEQVQHDVDVEIDAQRYTLQILAVDPINAIDKIRKMADKECLSYLKNKKVS